MTEYPFGILIIRSSCARIASNLKLGYRKIGVKDAIWLHQIMTF